VSLPGTIWYSKVSKADQYCQVLSGTGGLVVDPSADPYDGLGDAIKALRLERGATRNDVKHAAQISVEYLGKIERGERNPQPDVLARIAEALGTTPAELLERARGTRREALVSLAGLSAGAALGAVRGPAGALRGGLLSMSLISAAKDLRRGADRARLLAELERRLAELSDEELALLVAAIPAGRDGEGQEAGDQS
jgi:transcriptional regulator with XRE-family HTH domain